MKKIYLWMLMMVFSLSWVSAQCNYSLQMLDSYGDGWNGNTIDVLVNGAEVLDDVTLASGYSGTLSFSVEEGDQITTVWNGGGSFGGETSYNILDSNGETVGTAAQEDISTAIVATCPSCPAPSDLATSGVTLTSADLSWAAGGTETSWNIEYGTEGFIQGSGTAVSGVTSNSYSLTGLTAYTSYDVYVQADCGGAEGTSTWFGPYTLFTGYCTPLSSGEDTYIDSFTTTGGTQNISNTGTGFSAGGYADNSTTFVTSYAGGDFDFSAEIVGGSAGFSIWVDWNNDFILDNSTERVFSTSSYGYGPFTGTVSVPSGTAIGDYRMRITTDYYASSPSSPCAEGSRSEFEDYTITVGDSPDCLPPSGLTASNLTAVSADLSWTAGGAETLWNIEYGEEGFTQGSGTTVSAVTSNSYSLTGLTGNTSYDVYVQTDCGAEASAWVSYNFSTPIAPPDNDICADAIAVVCDDTVTGNTSSASADDSLTMGNTGLSGTLASAPGVWYFYAGDGSQVTLSLCDSSFDTKIGVFTGTCDALVGLAYNDDSDDCSGNQSVVTFDSEAGTTYYIYVTGYSTNSGAYSMSVSCVTAETDTDGDGVPDLEDDEVNSDCPDDVDENGVSNDDDGDGVPNCLDQEEDSPCPDDVDENGVSNDDDGDGILNCNDICPDGDDNVDTDNDGTPDACDTSYSFEVACASGGLTDQTYCYDNDEEFSWTFTSSTGDPVSLSFSEGSLETTTSGGTYDDMVIYDGTDDAGTELFNSDTADDFDGDLSGMSFIAPSGSIFVSFDSDGSNSCASGQQTSWTYSVTCVAAETDTDGDGVVDIEDNCPEVANADQADMDNDEIGDVCDEDIDGDGVLNDDDCNPNDASVGAATTWYADADNDGYGDAETSMESCTQPNGYVDNDEDCDDSNAAINPGAEEILDNDVDENCDGIAARTGSDCSAPIVVSSLPYTTTDDTSLYGNNYSASPGSSCGSTFNYLGGDDVVYAYTATEDGEINISMTPTETYSGIFVYSSCENIGVSCEAGVANSNAEVRTIENFAVTANQTYYLVISTWPAPQNTEFTLNIEAVNVVVDTDGDGIADDEDNCPTVANADQADMDNDEIGDVCDDDIDGDGVLNDDDCNPNDASVGAATTWYADADNDGYGDADTSMESCTQPNGYVSNDTDCDDTDANIHPGATEIPGNGIDEDCDGSDAALPDSDNDGVADINDNCPTVANADQADMDDDGQGDVCDDDIDGDGVANDDDCNPNDASVGAATTWYADADNDGYGDADTSMESCTQPNGYVSNDTDCDDTDATIHPGATEVANDGIDQDCDGSDLIEGGDCPTFTADDYTLIRTGYTSATLSVNTDQYPDMTYDIYATYAGNATPTQVEINDHLHFNDVTLPMIGVPLEMYAYDIYIMPSCSSEQMPWVKLYLPLYCPTSVEYTLERTSNNSAVLDADHNGADTMYDIYVTSAGNGSPTLVEINDHLHYDDVTLPLVVNGIPAGQDYDVYISPSCSSDQLPWEQLYLPLYNAAGIAVELYPNPVTDILYVKTVNEIRQLTVYDGFGRLVMSVKNSNQINVNVLKAGKYMLEVIDESGNTEVEQFIVER